MPTPFAAAAKQVHRFALGLPGAHEDHPWGETVVKVGKKIFVFLGRPRDGGPLTLSVKLPLSGSDLLLSPIATPTAYGLGKSGWVTLEFDSRRKVPVAEVCSWVEESYRAIAPKKLSRQLDEARAKPAAAPKAARAKPTAPRRARSTTGRRR
jgi:predicted DNA-binding protein (MmcQ/YjbR family)